MLTCSYNYESPEVMRQRVVECNDYRHSNEPALHEMQKIAWILRTSISGASIGFMPAKEYAEKFGQVTVPE